MKRVKSPWRHPGTGMDSACCDLRRKAPPAARVRRGACWSGEAFLEGLPVCLLAVAVLGALAGCGGLPMSRVQEAGTVGVRLDSPTRLLKPGDASRFQVRIENLGNGALSLRGLTLRLEAWKTSPPPTRLESPVFPIHGLDLDLAPGKHATIPLRPERQEFPLDGVLPGDYQVRVTANERFTSAPLTIRVLPLRSPRR